MRPTTVFLGEKPLQNLTDRIQLRKVVKVPYTGNYLYKGLPLETYKKVRRDLGKAGYPDLRDSQRDQTVLALFEQGL